MNAHSRDYRSALPNAIEAEQVTLGGIFLDNGVYWKLAAFLKPEHFGEKLHEVIFDIIGKLMAQGREVTALSVKPYLPVGDIGDKSIFLYVIELPGRALGTKAIEQSARGVLAAWARRQIVARLEDGIALTVNMAVDANEAAVIADVVGSLVSIANQISEGTKAISMADAVGQAITAIDDAYNFKRPAGISTGIDSVDQLTGPWEPGQQIIVGGGTKQGKSALAMQCAVGLAAAGPVWVYSGEMSVKQLAMREIARRTGIPVWRQKEGRLSTSERERLHAVKREVERLPILIEKRRLTLEQIHQIGRELKAERGLAAMVIDHVGLLAWGRDDARREEHALSVKATQELKAIYEDLRIPGMSLVQLKKNTFAQDFRGRQSFEQRLREAINRRPKYTDLMGAVERDADHVIIPFNARPIVAGLEPEEGSDDYLLWEDKMKEHERKAEIILALSREKQFPSRRQVEWNGETTSFGAPFVGRQESLLPGGY